MKTFLIGAVREDLRTMGRVYWDPETGYPWFDWSLCGIEFRYTGRVLTGHFRAESSTEPGGAVIPQGITPWQVWPRFAVYLDEEKEPHRIFTVDNPDKDEILFSSDKKEDHTIRIVKLTEALKTGACLDSFFGDGQILKARHRKRKKIECIGDSITCGYGNLGGNWAPGYFSEHQDGTKAYGAIAAVELDMEYSMIGYSGACAGFKKWNGKPWSVLEMYDYTDYIRQKKAGCAELEPWDFRHHHPDYAVINLGTNDAEGVFFMDGDPAKHEKAFEQYYHDLIAKVREKNGLYTKIICALGDMNYYLFDAICRAAERFRSETGDTKIYTLKLRGYSQKEIRGTKNHPGADSHLLMGHQLAEFIRSLEEPSEQN